MSVKEQRYRWLSRYLPKTDKTILVVLTGSRQTGKTTLVKELYNNLRYINLDAPENRQIMRQMNSLNWARDVGIAVFDEAQKEPAIFEKIKFAYDAKEISFSVILGSAQILLLEKIRESLAGRVFLYELWPLMMSELITATNQTAKKPLFDELLNTDNFENILNGKNKILLLEEEVKLKEAENYLLKWGGMPALLGLDDDEKNKWLKSYEYTYLERDLSDLAKLKDLDAFRKFQQLAALRSGKLFSYSQLARDSGISVDSARRYLEYLRLSYQVIFLQPYYENLTSSVIKSPKMYFVDVGILRQLAGFTGEASGEIYETHVVSEIFKWINTNQKMAELFFYRTKSGLEVDLIIKTEKGFIGVEIKSSQKLTTSDYKPMTAIAQQLKDKWLGGICVYRGKSLEKLSSLNIWAIPSYRLFS